MDQMDGFCAQPGSETRHIANQSQISAPLRLEFRCAVSIALSYSLYLKMSSLTLGGQFIKGCKISSNSHQCFGSKATAFLDYAGSQPWKRVTKTTHLLHHQASQAGGLQSKNRITDSVFSLCTQGITNERKRKLEQQLQSIMVLNRQFEHVQNFINWAVCSKTSVPFLFSKELVRRTPAPQSLLLSQ